MRTSSRMHEYASLPCIFGCEGQTDCLKHYLCCSPLWTLLIGVTVPRTALLEWSSFNRLAISHPTLASVCLIALAYQAYQTIKLGARGLVDNAVESNDFSEVHASLLRESIALACEYRQLRSDL